MSVLIKTCGLVTEQINDPQKCNIYIIVSSKNKEEEKYVLSRRKELQKVILRFDDVKPP
jgi:hypothetical protein